MIYGLSSTATQASASSDMFICFSAFATIERLMRSRRIHEGPATSWHRNSDVLIKLIYMLRTACAAQAGATRYGRGARAEGRRPLPACVTRMRAAPIAALSHLSPGYAIDRLMRAIYGEINLNNRRVLL
ncbi:hypothetical protein EVAR_11964_1 [Eumeta japonica]|uniref:Uncharacterized protein n=1 Tax=Eumeta variegata TaxID=151549 RepID=A0A4C1U4P4_EUMVA|nr:hypothetical protein EVAR_11964_1 [Eumeta japonica]